ncbi:L-threonylcarbamoyladenylate synthase [Thalassobacillus pellis]|uniref:L-threonylcarbamoyladenylate synthase n=1 Tax=Thalassobacillus pellis TaxID=748008 RepID=UPI001960AC54|nr:L-threonylcarbamoyladenylate synthase [Thalassobacillus pellis]MBM7551776.1 L-threonylcarbamoyladenylate synthase [Thalassobacillus pellis]
MDIETKIWKINPSAVADYSRQIDEAVRLLEKGEVVAFPTETVYGLSADATCEQAVDKIFRAKGRPADNPLIVHVAEYEQIGMLVTSIPGMARKLIDRFMPGPLTLVLKSNGTAAKNVTAGLDTVAVRMPDHPVAIEVLKASSVPLAAPSANRSGRPSPTDADHVYQDLHGRIGGIIDGGPTGVGLESTVVDCTGEIPVILRPGGITREQIEQVTGEVMVDPALADQKDQPKSPGMKYTHYAPESPLWLIDGDDSFFLDQLENLEQEGSRVGVIASSELATQLLDKRVISCGSRDDLKEIAVHLYKALREFKKSDVDVILCESFPEHGVGEAIMNRLEKAAVKKINQF